MYVIFALAKLRDPWKEIGSFANPSCDLKRDMEQKVNWQGNYWKHWLECCRDHSASHGQEKYIQKIWKLETKEGTMDNQNGSLAIIYSCLGDEV